MNSIAALPSGFQAITVRYPTTVSLSYAQLAPRVRDTAPTSDPFALVAESFSTPLAIQIAAEDLPNMKALVLCAGFATSPVRGWRRFLASALAPILFRLPLPTFLQSAPSSVRTPRSKWCAQFEQPSLPCPQQYSRIGSGTSLPVTYELHSRKCESRSSTCKPGKTNSSTPQA